jgi:TonB-linked SusC/RagA family outer membrane protein
MSMGLALAQTRTVSGVVISGDDGEPIIGASVSVKGKNLGTATNHEGRFVLANIPTTEKTLIVAFLGYTTQEVAIASDLRIVLQPSTQLLDEVVVSAMNIPRSKKSFGSASQNISGAELTKTPVSDLNNALVGRVAGAHFLGASGSTFDGGRIMLRGTSSLTAVEGSEPIYVVDGVITNVAVINMDNVESVNILKGAAATALYGSRGGNGAVIITSKKGASAGQRKSTVEFSQSFGWEEAVPYASFQNEYGGGTVGVGGGEMMVFEYDPSVHPEYLKALDGVRYYDMENDMSWGAKFDGEPFAPWYAWYPDHPKFGQTAPYVGQTADNLKSLYRTGLTSNTSVAFSKTVNDFTTRVSIANKQRQGILENSEAIRRYVDISTEYNVNDRLNISGTYKYTFRKNHNAAEEDYSGTRTIQSSYTQWFHRDVDINDLRNYKRPDGTFYTWNPTDVTTGDFSPMYHNNPFAIMNEINVDDTYQWNVIAGTVNFDIIKNVLSVGATINANIRAQQYETKVPYNISGATSTFSLGQNQLTDIQSQGFAKFFKRFIDNRFDVSVNLFIEQRDYAYRSLSGSTVDGLTADRFWNLAASVSKASVGNSLTKLKEQSAFGNAVLGWDNTYYLELSLRNDWSSTLPTKNNSYLYGGASLAAIVSNYIKADWLDLWKLRASAAQVGSSMGAYQTEQIYVNQSKYNGMTSIRGSKNLLNPNIRPTISTSYEVGTEFKIANNRLYGDVTLYNKDSKDQIIDLNTAPSSGFTSTKINSGLIRNRGIEITLGGSPIKTKNFEWELYANWAKNDNKLVELDPSDPEKTQYRLYGMAFYNYLYTYAEVGKPIGVIRGSTYDMDPQGRIVYRALASGHWAGDYVPLLNQTGNIELGNVQPDATGGFGTTLRYRDFKLDLAFDYQIGGDIGSVTNMFGEGSGLMLSTVGNNDKGVPIRNATSDGGGVKVDGVVRTGTGDDATYEEVSGYLDAYYWYYYKSAIWGPNMYKATYLKMRELALTYTLPRNLLNKISVGLNKASIGFNIQNPWLIYSGIPNVDASEVGNAYGHYLEMGQIYGSRTYGLTINLTF